MKFYIKLLIVFASIMNCLIGCDGCKCPPNIKLGDVKMLNPSFFPLKGGETLKYINDKNEIIVLTDSSDKQQENLIIVESLCSKPPISSQFSYYTGTPSYNLRFVNTRESLNLSFSFLTTNTQQLPKDTVLCDYLNINFKSMKKFNSFQLVASDRGNRTLLGPNKGKNADNIKMVDTLINGKKYERVYYLSTDKSFLYAEKIGVIAFTHKNENWYLMP